MGIRLAHRLALDPELEVVGSTGDVEEGLRLAKLLSPDVALVDLKVSGRDGIELCRSLSARGSRTKVAVGLVFR